MPQRPESRLRVIGIAIDCGAFTWEGERELCGRPRALDDVAIAN